MRQLAELDADLITARALIRGRHSYLTATLIAVLSLLIVASVGWAAWAEVDEVVQAQGRVEPAGRAKLINHEKGGKVAVLHVRNGMTVKPGDLLVTLNADVDAGERSELLGQWQAKAFEATRLRSESEGIALDDKSDLARARPDLLIAEQELMQARDDALHGKQISLVKVIEIREGDVRSLGAELSRIENSLELMDQQVAAVRQLYERGLYPKLKLVELERQVSDATGERAKTRADLAGSRAALAEAKSRLSSVEKEWRRDVLSDLGRTTAERDRIWERLQGQEAVLEGMTVTAPVEGIVQDVAITTKGQSVPANEPFMKIVPLGDDMVVQAEVANDDISKIKDGMDATIKVRAFDFTRFGTLMGKVDRIAADSTKKAENEGFVYNVRIKAVTDENASTGIEIMPGMLVNVELKVGERSILSYVTERVVKWRDLAFKES